MTAKLSMKRFAEYLYEGYDNAGILHGSPPEPSADGVDDPPPSFNLNSMFYHVGASLPLLHEGPHGLKNEDYHPSHHDILDIYHTLFTRSAKFLIKSDNQK